MVYLLLYGLDFGIDCSLCRDEQEERKTAKFAQYALAATQEALEDAGWKPEKEEEKEMTVSC